MEHYGKTTLEDGTTVIAATRRADGTWRKERKVKAGYTPPDEQEKYQSTAQIRAENRKRAENNPIPGFVTNPPKSMGNEKLTKNQKKALSKKRAKEQQQLKEEEELRNRAKNIDSVTQKVEAMKISTAASSSSSTTNPTEEVTVDSLNKKIRATSKKLRQAEELKVKIDKGEVSPDADQLVKISKIEEFQNTIKDYEEQKAKL